MNTGKDFFDVVYFFKKKWANTPTTATKPKPHKMLVTKFCELR